MSNSEKGVPPYRFGILVDSRGPRNWELWCARNLVESQWAVPCLIGMVEPRRYEDQGLGTGERTACHLGRLYQRLLSQLPSLRRTSADTLVQTLARWNHRLEIVTDGSPGGSLYRQRLEELDLDFILGFVDPAGLEQYVRMAHIGVWCFSGHQGQSLSRDVPFFESLIRREHTVTVSLHSHSTADESQRRLWGGCYGIDPNFPGRDLERVLRDISKWPQWVCTRMYNGSCQMPDGMPPVAKKVDRPRLSVETVLTWPVKLLYGQIARKASDIFLRPQWNIAVLKRPIHTLLSQPAVHEARFLDIGRGTNAFWADPFGVRKEGVLTILFEKYDYESERGTIAFLRLAETGIEGGPSTVFEELHHLSYPFIFQDGENIYCVPESGRAGRIEIHRAVRFPEIWERIALVNGSVSAIDSTVFRYNGRWWLACTLIEHELNTNLFLYHAEDLTGPWEAHRCNPVKTDVRSSRPAGTPFFYEGELYRPAQDCSRSYGRRVCVNRVVRLDPIEYVEEEVCTIEPAPGSGYPDGLHTISAADDWTLIDGLRRRFVWTGLVRSIRRRCRNLVSRRLSRKLLRTLEK